MICGVLELYIYRRKYWIAGLLLIFLLDFYGFFAHLFEKEFSKGFEYPYDGDVSGFIEKIQRGVPPEMKPFNYYNYSIIFAPTIECHRSENLRLVYIIKSKVDNFEKREVIRRTWGYERRFSDVTIRTFFVLGKLQNYDFQSYVFEEHENFKDIIQFDFFDSYFNNTIKTMCAFKWLVKYCPNAKFYYFSDDDMYVSTKNVLRFLRNPVNYPDYLKKAYNSNKVKNESSLSKRKTDLEKINYRNSLRYELPRTAILFAGFVFVSSPHRHKSSKWYVPLREYPYNMWPPYVTAGAYVLSKEALLKLYYTSLYTKHFRFDDIYLGIVALKAGIEPFHCDYFHFYKKAYNKYSYRFVIASHGYDDMSELESVWIEQKEEGNA